MHRRISALTRTAELARCAVRPNATADPSLAVGVEPIVGRLFAPSSAQTHVALFRRAVALGALCALILF